MEQVVNGYLTQTVVPLRKLKTGHLDMQNINKS